MAEWIPIAVTGGVVLVFQILILIKLGSIGNEQAEAVRAVNLLMDMVERQGNAMQKEHERKQDTPEEQPSLISYRKPALIDETKAKPPPPPPPPAKRKRW